MARSAENRIEKSHLAIMKHPNFCAWSGLLFIGKWKVDDSIPTACVNAAGDCTYGRTFIDKCMSVAGVDAEVNYTVLHENGHKALLHLIRGRKYFEANANAANIAADHVVNNMIEEIDPEHKFASPPKQIKVCCDPKYKGMSLKEVYTDLMKNPPPADAKPMDTHDPSGFEEGEKDPAAKDQAMDALDKEITDALRSGSYLAGKMGGKQSRTLADLLEPKIDWKDALREFVLDSCMGDDEASWVRPHRRFVGEDIYFPTSISEQMGELVAAIDTSGSIGHREMTAMISELLSIAKNVNPSGIRIIYWSDGVESEESYTPDQYDDIPRLTKPVGGGGTSVHQVATRLQELDNIQCCVVLTDGYIYGSWGGEWPCPTLWAITTDVVSPIGKTVHFTVD